MDGANLHLEDSDSKRNKANIGAPNIELIEQLECVFGRPGHQVVARRPTFDAAVRQLTQRLGHGTGDDSGYGREDGGPHKGIDRK